MQTRIDRRRAARDTVLAVAFLAAGPASALSCLRPDAVRLYEDARDSAEVYTIVKGRILADGPILVPVPDRDGKNGLVTGVRLRGHILGARGFLDPVEAGIGLRLTCVSVWCAAPPPEDVLLMALRQTPSGSELSIGPCGGDAVVWTADAEARLLDCHRGIRCEVPDF